jgi:hypothetical protein
MPEQYACNPTADKRIRKIANLFDAEIPRKIFVKYKKVINEQFCHYTLSTVLKCDNIIHVNKRQVDRVYYFTMCSRDKRRESLHNIKCRQNYVKSFNQNDIRIIHVRSMQFNMFSKRYSDLLSCTKYILFVLRTGRAFH